MFPVPQDLQPEVNRLHTLERVHIRHEFQDGALLMVPYPEAEPEVAPEKLKAKFVANDEGPALNQRPAHGDVGPPRTVALQANIHEDQPNATPSSTNAASVSLCE
jgi:hypothetical protein